MLFMRLSNHIVLKTSDLNLEGPILNMKLAILAGLLWSFPVLQGKFQSNIFKQAISTSFLNVQLEQSIIK
jgi:hypothetical protein